MEIPLSFNRLLKKAIRHAERSEASAVSSGKQTKQILRFAQDDAAREVFQQPVKPEARDRIENGEDKQRLDMKTITRSTSIAEILKQCPTARRIFDQHGLHGCGGGNGPAESLEFFASVHQADLEALLRELNAEVQNPLNEVRTYQETLPDYIYRRFFKTAIVIVLSLGGLWGVIALLQISLRKELLQPQLLPFIHAHAHAMIFGWVGLFVMGFAYQSFPRFKVTTLWRPRLANLTLYLMVGGILLRAA